MNVLNLFSRGTTCRHPSVCPATPGPNELMCPAHAADEPLAPNAGDRLAPWNLDRPANERRAYLGGPRAEERNAMAELRILVTGSRLWRYPATIRRVLDETVIAHIANDRAPDVTVIHGGAKGADAMAGRYAIEAGWNVDPRPADWANCAPDCKPGHRRVGKAGEYCPTAGHRRNKTMVDSRPDIVLAFCRDHSSGTKNCVELAHAAGLLIDPYLDCACHPVGQPIRFI